jgi:hypothetical protein
MPRGVTHIFQWIYRHIYTRTPRVMYIHTYIYKHIYKYMCVQKCTELCSILGSCMWKSLSSSKNASNTLPMEAISSYAHTCIYASCSCAFPKIRWSLQTNTLAATKKNSATMSLSCQHCRIILASCKRNQPNAYHSDYQNHEDASVGLDSFSQCIHLKERPLKGSNIFPEATSSWKLQQWMPYTCIWIHMKTYIFQWMYLRPWHMYMCDILCVHIT